MRFSTRPDGGRALRLTTPYGSLAADLDAAAADAGRLRVIDSAGDVVGLVRLTIDGEQTAATEPREAQPPARGIAARVAGAATSMASVVMGVRRAPASLAARRLAVCESCPDNHAAWLVPGSRAAVQPADPVARARIIAQGGVVASCGPLLGRRAGTCGCALGPKAADSAQACPSGWWPSPADESPTPRR